MIIPQIKLLKKFRNYKSNIKYISILSAKIKGIS
jgi:hypothetical protein